MFRPEPAKPFIATPAAIEMSSHEVIVACWRLLRQNSRELDAGLVDRPTDRVRLPGAGRKPLEKKTPTSSET